MKFSPIADSATLLRISSVALLLGGILLLPAGAAFAATDSHPAPAPAAPVIDSTAHYRIDIGGSPPNLDSLLQKADSLLKALPPNASDQAQLFLSWDAPWGMPRATTARWPHPADARAADTLWLCFKPGRTSVGFLGFSADLYFHAAPGDTLGPWWHMEHGAPNNGAVIAEFGPDEESFPQRQPWKAGGMPYAKMDRTPSSAHLWLLFAVPYTQAAPVIPDSVYTLCRVIFRHRRNMPGSGQPVCIEWGNAGLDYWLKDSINCNRGERFVAYASDAAVCASFRPMSASSAPARPKDGTPRRRTGGARRPQATPARPGH